MTGDDDKPRFQVIEGAGEGDHLHDDPGANDEALELKITELEAEHRELDQAILTMEERMPYDRLTIGRMKKRKLALRDEIQRLRDKLFPDIIA
ncbi:MAG: DUF465 domain-containing protein [Pseudomonadota bacterium]